MTQRLPWACTDALCADTRPSPPRVASGRVGDAPISAVPWPLHRRSARVLILAFLCQLSNWFSSTNKSSRLYRLPPRFSPRYSYREYLQGSSTPPLVDHRSSPPLVKSGAFSPGNVSIMWHAKLPPRCVSLAASSNSPFLCIEMSTLCPSVGIARVTVAQCTNVTSCLCLIELRWIALKPFTLSCNVGLSDTICYRDGENRNKQGHRACDLFVEAFRFFTSNAYGGE